MKQIAIQSIIQKSTRLSNKKGYIEVKYRTRFINPLTETRREITSDWYVLPNKKDKDGRIKISSQVKALIYKELQEKANLIYESITKEAIRKNTNITLDEVWNEWHSNRIKQKLVAPKTLAGEEGRYRNHIIKS